MQSSPQLFDAIRSILGPLSQPQVDTVNAILLSCENHGVTDHRQIAYIIATGIHECGLKPIPESLGSRQGRKYNNPDPVTGQTYYGRGIVQLTWKDNYQTFGNLLHLDLIHNPDLALQIPTAAEIAVIGMKGGMFTGVGLSRYFNDTRTDAVNCRKVINGLDQANLIAGYYDKVFNATA